MPSLAGLRRPHTHLPAPRPIDTMRWMAKLAKEAQFDQQIRELVEKITRGVFSHDYLSEYAAILNWVRTNIRYMRDPKTIEQVKTPRAVIETETGDCDDMATVVAALVGLAGGRSRFVAGAFKKVGGQPVLTHVWCEGYDPTSKAWVILDPVPGRRVPQMAKRLLYSAVIPAVE